MTTVPLHHKILGQGFPVIILHGLFGMLDNLLLMAKKLEDAGFMPILLDQRNHGRSPHTDTMDYTTMSEDVYRFMTDNWIHEAIVIGHSMGGKTALQLTARHESVVTKLIVIDIGVKKYEHGHDAVFEALFSIDIDSVTSRSDVESELLERLGDIGTVRFLMKNLTRNPEGGFQWKANLPTLFQSYENIIDAVKWDHPCQTDTLFIKGGQSRYILDEDWSEIQKYLPQAHLHTIEHAGHWLHVDAPDELFQQIIHFIKP
jgi:pimeloyl-ACP methyl ester carboxylesterase